jgi:uncharacterized protein (DUF934 family)
MANLIRQPKGSSAQVAVNEWQILPADTQEVLGSGKYLVPLQYWLDHSGSADIEKKYLVGELGIWLSSDADLAAQRDVILAGIKFWPIIAVDFPIFRDGRGFSHAALLRDRFGWQGELRAIGDVLIDQLLQMSKVGFDSFLLRADQDVSIALHQFEAFSHRLQNDWRAGRDQLSGVKHVTQ